MHNAKKRIKREADSDWHYVVDDAPATSAPRFFNMAHRILGYTHTEAGFRTIVQLDAEYYDYIDGMKPSEENEIRKIYDEEVV